MRKTLLFGLVLVSGLVGSHPSVVFSEGGKAGNNGKKPVAVDGDVKEDLGDLRKDRREFRQDLRNKADPKELQQDWSKLKGDRRQLFQDMQKKRMNQKGNLANKRPAFGKMVGKTAARGNGFGKKNPAFGAGLQK